MLDSSSEEHDFLVWSGKEGFRKEIVRVDMEDDNMTIFDMAKARKHFMNLVEETLNAVHEEHGGFPITSLPAYMHVYLLDREETFNDLSRYGYLLEPNGRYLYYLRKYSAFK